MRGSGYLNSEDGLVALYHWEAQVMIESWRQHYNTVRPHSSLGYKPPAPEAILPRPAGLPYATLRSAQQGDHCPSSEHLGRVSSFSN